MTSQPHLTLTVLKEPFAICQLDPQSPLPPWTEKSTWLSMTRSQDELSLVCNQNFVPDVIECDRDWKGMRIEGPLGLSLVGILDSLVGPLADANVSIFSISTFKTNYLFVKEKDLETSIQTLSHEGHWISRG